MDQSEKPEMGLKKRDKSADRTSLQKKKPDWKYRLFLTALTVVFFYSVGKIIQTLKEYQEGSREYDELREVVLRSLDEGESTVTETFSTKEELESTKEEMSSVSQTQKETAETALEKETTTSMRYVDFSSLKSMNSDAQGWIRMEGTAIDYPIVLAPDNEYYLKRTISGTKNSAGTLFIDCHIEDGIEGKNVIVYGHNMRNGTMFGELKKYREEDMAKRYPTFEVYTKDKSYQYEIFAVYMTTASSDTYTYQFADEESFLDYIERMKAQSLYNRDVKVEAQDRIMTLSTCEGSEEDRFVVQARRVP